MNPLATFFVDLLICLVAFRYLSTQPARLPGWARLALGFLVVFAATALTLWFGYTALNLGLMLIAAALASIAIEGEGLLRLTEALGRHRLAIYLLAIAGIAGLIFLVAPITTFLTSPGEIGIHLDHLLRVNARDAMTVVYVAAALYLLALTSRMRSLLALLALWAFAISLVYAFALPFGYPMMTGLTFEQIPISGAARLLRFGLDLLVILAVGVGVVVALLRYGSRPVLVAIVAANASLAVAALVSVQRDEPDASGSTTAATQPLERPLRFSRTHPNVLVMFLDRFMGSYIESIVKDDPAIAQRLSGFTWYPRTVSAGENSIAGVHGMLGGYDYIPVEMNNRHQSLRDLSVEAFAILPRNFGAKGYRVNVVNPRGLGFTMEGDCRYLAFPNVHCTHIPSQVMLDKARQTGFPLTALSKSNYVDLLVLLGSMRGMPYTLKEVLRIRGPWRPFLDHSAGTTFREWAELHALDELTATDATESNYNFVSNILAHEPYYMGEDCVPMGQPLNVAADEVRRRGHESLFSLQHENAARCLLRGVADYLDRLKQAGVYDNTSIVIVSDHGIVGEVRDNSTRAVAGGTQDNVFVRTRSVLLVKDIGASGALRISEEFMPNAEVPRIVCAQIGGCVNPYLGNKAIAAEGRDDPFHVSLVPWQFNLQKPDAFVIDTQLVLRGRDPYRAAGWELLQ